MTDKCYRKEVACCSKSLENSKLDDHNLHEIAGYTNSKDMLEVEGDQQCLGNYITREYALLRSILSYLPIKDLLRAENVCKTWETVANIVKQARTGISWIFWHSGKGQPKMEEELSCAFGKTVYAKPNLCITFVSHNVANPDIYCSKSPVSCPLSKEKNSRCKKRHKFLQYLQAELPPSCKFFMVQGYGIVGTAPDLSYTIELEGRKAAYSGLFLPNIPGVYYSPFRLTSEKCRLIKRQYVSAEEVEKIAGLTNTGLPIRCLILFCLDENETAANILFATLQCRQEQKIALAGAYADVLMDPLEDFSKDAFDEANEIGLCGLAISGDGFTVATTIIESPHNTIKQVDQVMEELQSCNLPSKNSIGLMFACSGRGKNYFDKPNVESTSFRKHFPKTPVIGYFGNGEIGQTFLPGITDCSDDGAEAPVKKPRIECLRILHSFTTIIMYLSFHGVLEKASQSD